MLLHYFMKRWPLVSFHNDMRLSSGQHAFDCSQEHAVKSQVGSVSEEICSDEYFTVNLILGGGREGGNKVKLGMMIGLTPCYAWLMCTAQGSLLGL